MLVTAVLLRKEFKVLFITMTSAVLLLFDLELLHFAVEEEVAVERVVVRRVLVLTVAHQVLVEVHHLLVELAGRRLAELHAEVHLIVASGRCSTISLQNHTRPANVNR